MPAPSCRIYPERTRNLWLATSASAGASRSVGIKSCDQRCIVGVLDERELVILAGRYHYGGAGTVQWFYVLLNLASPTPAPISNDPAIRFVSFSNRGLRAVLKARPASCP